MAATMATMAVLNSRCLSINSPKFSTPPKPTHKPISLLSLQSLPKGLTTPIPLPGNQNLATSLAGTAVAGAFFSALSSCDAAFAAQQIAEIAAESGSDNRGLALLLPLIPAVAWVLFNILQPALNQLNRMRSSKGIVAVGIGGLTAAAGMVAAPPEASASVAEIAAAGSDNRGQLLLFVVAPAIAWVLYNILQPALNQLNKMRSE